jgi:hypothetical protein
MPLKLETSGVNFEVGKAVDSKSDRNTGPQRVDQLVLVAEFLDTFHSLPPLYITLDEHSSHFQITESCGLELDHITVADTLRAALGGASRMPNGTSSGSASRRGGASPTRLSSQARTQISRLRIPPGNRPSLDRVKPAFPAGPASTSTRSGDHHDALTRLVELRAPDLIARCAPIDPDACRQAPSMCRNGVLILNTPLSSLLCRAGRLLGIDDRSPRRPSRISDQACADSRHPTPSVEEDVDADR